ncbi:RNA polymerase sigma factor [Aequorivita sp. F47161]|uniref:RNA polymerase sigma factor n=1 Tax=Aequorivita vitellina TaxID=2874475 RepID=A0A9X1QXS0_9FLAO|nr:RNA polymerase sigma factor [Aequorivita vitellina]MCG2419317.1 RNA polymerase sigma factor [Aequorivita vitellina]MCZ4318910.1 RNA polymerase sigma factor [Aequorivita viscosa]
MNATQPNKYVLTKLSDSIVVQRVLDGEKELFEILMRRYNQRLFRVVRSYIYSEDDVQDILQDAYVKAYTKLYQFNNQSSFSTWLIRIAINEALQDIRKKKRQLTNYGKTESLENVFQLPDTNTMNPEKQAIKTETKALVEKAVDALPEKYRVVFVMHQIEGLSNPEIAACLKLSDSNVKVRLHRAKNLLKDELFKTTHDASIFEFGNHKCDLLVEKVMKRIENV